MRASMKSRKILRKTTRDRIIDGSCAALITAAGSGVRMGGGIKKEYLRVSDKPLLLHVLEAFEKSAVVSLYLITVPPGGEQAARAVLAPWLAEASRARITFFAAGGGTRQQSVYHGLCALERLNPAFVLIHDGARPWVRPELIRAVLEGVKAHGACLPLAPAVDALKEVNAEGFVQAHLARARIRGAQTPQGFVYAKILEAHRRAADDGRACLDDTEIYAAYAGPVFSIPGDERNKKITYPSDLREDSGARTPIPRTGFGYDLHRLAEGRRLLLGGVELPSPKGEEGHSDGDVLIHALIDALLGAAGLGDIGEHFPPSEAAYKDISSRILLRRAARLVYQKNLRVVNLDCTVILESPRILPYRQAILANLAEDLNIPPEVISVKGKTKERVDAAGEGRAIEAYAAVLLV
jgi:2-C-methyl-D-erythritol 4-phosphate cytidylyltransferase/2-C-methyl-D-erythritol 2,4-cyclodiphosphate synthase